MPKEPGFIVGGRPIVGKALLFRGKEVVCIQKTQTTESHHASFMWKLDYATDIQPEDYIDLTFLSVKQASSISESES